ncbi:hypothetical protein V5037_05540 [Enterobacter ludwigii]|uniref:hypothetical protein n=1 Tax=Enterobacter ludwigii TaxID=299767 RepID=UPI0006432290|nr:hypothetical protein [Enterobacter ludwigii]KLP33492.1 hypothetical protein ABR36_23590 [Enterobacter ludwigii]HDR2735784.1 hypothetical protein [Enterobacter ludwigii]
MNSKSVDLKAATEELVKLVENLQVQERAYDEAIEHSANYMGYDEKIENVRDERARSAFESVEKVKKEIENQTNLIASFVKNS